MKKSLYTILCLSGLLAINPSFADEGEDVDAGPVMEMEADQDGSEDNGEDAGDGPSDEGNAAEADNAAMPEAINEGNAPEAVDPAMQEVINEGKAAIRAAHQNMRKIKQSYVKRLVEEFGMDKKEARKVFKNKKKRGRGGRRNG